MAQKMLETSPNTAFWGGDNWRLWPEFSPYYQEELIDIQSLLEATSSLRINVHNTGSNLHSRIVDSMSVGVPNAVMHNDSDSGPFGIEQFFEPDVDFIRFTFENFSEKIKEYLKYPQLLDEISLNATRKVNTKYTWKHICHGIINDIQQHQ